MIRVLLFDDNKHLRESLSMYLANADLIYFIGAFADASGAVKLVLKYQPDIVLMDIQMPEISGIEAMKNIKNARPETRVLIQTVFEDNDKVFAAICAGANGYILKSTRPETYVQAINEVFEGGTHLSPPIARRMTEMFQNAFVQKQSTYVELTKREKEVLGCMVKGMSYKMVADACQISYFTVCDHVKHIYEKLHVNSAPEAVVKALEMRLVT